MVNVLLFHHVCGRTAGMEALADRLREGGHTVTVPDLLEGRMFASVDDGVAHVGSVGFDTIVARGVAAADDLPGDVVYAGVSLGVMPAMRLAVQRPGALGVLCLEGIVTPTSYGAWPAGTPVQAHAARDDAWAEVPILERVVADLDGELFLYDGDQHLFTDASLPAHDPDATDLVVSRTLTFLDQFT
jgi:dienelactone hydrolase